MSEKSMFFPDVDGDRGYDDTDLANYIHSFISNGVYNLELSIAAGENMQIIVPPGRAWINGYYYRNDGNLALAIANADGVLKRKDTVVLRWDINTRNITAQVLTGTFASNPVAPAIVRGAEQYDLKLAEIEIPAGATAITQANITDTRLNTDVCGIVAGVLQQIDTKTIGKQLDNFFELYRQQIVAEFTVYLNQLSSNETAATGKYNSLAALMDAYQSKAKSDFETWFNGIKGLLGADEAGNLANELNALKARISTLETTLSNNLLFSAAAWLGNSYSGCAYLSES
ncbi:hypothetical protein [Caproicibacterium sp. BJN0003]|uniref:hypothetical protein n=1 Tax=Caproicibacterium sp. BJN0003 TaxID=2994078 RepID=UPI002257ED1A|nr:hypothetical protein [Caproicibacterium sp. BJN0003]UZT82151.1 hypothetical protein OP489_11895 [Caproicibacterium sp. BJN0003]